MTYEHTTAIEFNLGDSKEMESLAMLTAQWVREGVTFTLRKDTIAIQVYLTGGY